MVYDREQRILYLNIKKLYMNKNYESLESKATKYLEKEPNDVKVRFMRAKAYRFLNRFDEAIEDLKYNLMLENNNHSLTELYYIYYHLNMYREALEILPLVYKNQCIKNYSLSISELVMKTQLGIPIRVKKDDNYVKSQIFNYSTKEAIEHIKQHLKESEYVQSIYNENINIDYLFNLVRNAVKDSKKANINELLEVYFFGISNIGYCNDIPCNFIKVVVIPNTNNIITMYPTNDVDYNYTCNIECDYDKLFKNQEKVKKISQIEKFNNRYKRV